MKFKKLTLTLSGKKLGSLTSLVKLVQPLTSIKGLGDKAMDQILDHRPFNTIGRIVIQRGNKLFQT